MNWTHMIVFVNWTGIKFISSISEFTFLFTEFKDL